MNDKEIYEKNLKTNTEKIQFWKFLINGTKTEVHIHSFMSLLYWVSILEIFLFLIGFALFLSSPQNFSIFWVFITHVVRAILGFILLKRIPHSHQVIEDLNEIETNSIEEIEKNILHSYLNLLSRNETKIRPILIWYFVLTIIDIIIDNFAFFYLQGKWSEESYSLQNFILSICIVINFLCNGVYFSWLGSVKFNFSPEMRQPIFDAIRGYFTGIKDLVVVGVRNTYGNMRNKFSRANTDNAKEVQNV